MQWKRGLWRVGWVLWAIAAVPTVFIAFEESRDQDHQWYEVTLDGPPSESTSDGDDRRSVDVPGIGKAYLSKQFTQEQTEKVISALKKSMSVSYRDVDEGSAPNQVYICNVEWKTNRPRAVRYSALGLNFGFAFIQGGFRLILWVIAGFRHS